MADSARRGVELITYDSGANGNPALPIFILWLVIDLLLALLLGLKTRAGRWWTQAILAVHVFYLGHELVSRPYLWLTMGLLLRARVIATIFLDGMFAAYLSGSNARAYLNDGP